MLVSLVIYTNIKDQDGVTKHDSSNKNQQSHIKFKDTFLAYFAL